MEVGVIITTAVFVDGLCEVGLIGVEVTFEKHSCIFVCITEFEYIGCFLDTVQIRGIGSFSNSKPLFVVDGMFYDNINFLNNADIQEMSILKDASAAAIYGVRAANGVVLITTKKGSRNQKAKITYDGYVGIQKASFKIDIS